MIQQQPLKYVSQQPQLEDTKQMIQQQLQLQSDDKSQFFLQDIKQGQMRINNKKSSMQQILEAKIPKQKKNKKNKKNQKTKKNQNFQNIQKKDITNKYVVQSNLFPQQFKIYQQMRRKTDQQIILQDGSTKKVSVKQKTLNELKKEEGDIKRFIRKSSYIMKNRLQFKQKLNQIKTKYLTQSTMVFQYKQNDELNMLKLINTQGVDIYAPNYICACLLFTSQVQFKWHNLFGLWTGLIMKKQNKKKLKDDPQLQKIYQKSDRSLILMVSMQIAKYFTNQSQKINFIQYNTQSKLQDPTVLEIFKFFQLNDTAMLANIIQFIVLFTRLLTPPMFWHYLISTVFFLNTMQVQSDTITIDNYKILDVQKFRQYFHIVALKLHQMVLIQSTQYMIVADVRKSSMQLVRNNNQIKINYQGVIGYCPKQFKLIDGKLTQGNQLKKNFKQFGTGSLLSAISKRNQYNIIPKQDNNAKRTIINRLIYDKQDLEVDNRSNLQKISDFSSGIFNATKNVAQFTYKHYSKLSCLSTIISWAAFNFGFFDYKIVLTTVGLQAVAWSASKLKKKVIKKLQQQNNQQNKKDQRFYEKMYQQNEKMYQQTQKKNKKIKLQ